MPQTSPVNLLCEVDTERRIPNKSGGCKGDGGASSWREEKEVEEGEWERAFIRDVQTLELGNHRGIGLLR